VKHPARQSGKANRQRLAKIVHHVLDETSVEAVVTKQHVRELTDELVEALVAAGALIPETKGSTVVEPTVGPEGGAGDSGAAGDSISIVISPSREDASPTAIARTIAARRNTSRYFR
jgi:hypothetical protein